MNPEWLCYVNGQEYGPYTWPQLVQMAQSGNVVPQTHVRRNFDSQWYLAEQVPGLFSAPAVSAAQSPKKAAHPTTPPRTAAPSKSSSLSKSGVQPIATAPVAPQVHAPVMEAPQQHAYQPAPQAAAPQQPAVPKGRAVAAPTTPVPVANADTKPQWIPVNPSASAPGAAATSAQPSFAVATQPSPSGEAAAIPGKKKDNNKQLVLYLGGAIAGVALLGGAVLIYKFTRPPEKPAEVAVAKPVEVPTTEADPNVISEESNGAEANPADVVEPAPKPNSTPTKQANTPASTAANTKPGAKAETPKATNTAGSANTSAALIKSVTAWKPLDKFGSIGTSSGLRCQKLECYLAADAAGRRVAWRPGSAPAAAPPAEGTPGEPSEPPQPAVVVPYVPAEAAPYLFVNVSIINTDKKARVYEGWNVSKTAAVVVDGQGNQLTLVPASQTPGVLRQPTKELQPNETIQDTLVFAVPDKADLLFRLALPKTAFTSSFSGAWAYEISRTDLVAAQETAAGPGQPGAPPAQARSSVTIPIPGLQDPPPPMPIQPAPAPEPEMEKKPMPTERIPIPGLTDTPENKPAGPKKPDEVPNLNPPQPKKK